MRTSHAYIRKRVLQESGKVSDEEFFSSPQLGAYLTDIAEGVSKRFGRGLRVETIHDTSESAAYASTNNKSITVNTLNSLSMSFPTRQLKFLSIIGLLGHELGHMLFTNFKIRNHFLTALRNGRFYPSKPSNLSLSESEALAEMEQYLTSGNQSAVDTLIFVAQDIRNMTEDIYIEERMCLAYPGQVQSGIRMNRVRMMEQTSSIQQQIDHGDDGYSILHNLMLQYCSGGSVNNPEGYEGEYLDALRSCIPTLDDCLLDDDIRTRLLAAITIMLKLWKYVKELVEKAKDQGADQIISGLQQSLIETTAEPQGITQPIGTDDDTSISVASRNEEIAEARNALNAVRIALEKTDELEDGNDGGVDLNSCYTGAGYQDAADDITRLLNSVAEERAYAGLEQELSDELQAESGKICYGNAHRGIHVTVNRMLQIPDYLREGYRQVAPPLLLLSKRLQAQVKQVLKDQKQGGKLTGLIAGKRFNPRSFVNDDGRYFYNTKLPQDDAELAVALLVDESGSMYENHRITSARAASIVIHDFCMSLGIPIVIMGHTANCKEVDLYSYADFDSVDGKDRYRLMDMTDRVCNRDGAALRYVAERLLKRPELHRLLIIISDGQPYDTGYTGTAAEADLRGIRLEYKRKGITLIAAAIGEDKARIERIYKEGYLDITDLQQLPIKLSRLIQQYVLRG